jgi:hypothetical protein
LVGVDHDRLTAGRIGRVEAQRNLNDVALRPTWDRVRSISIGVMTRAEYYGDCCCAIRDELDRDEG